MTYTGGLLNELNGRMGISAPFKSVPVMKLIRSHNPKSKTELVELIKFHCTNDCACGVRSQGSVEDFGMNLYKSQLTHWGEYKFSLKDCIQWEYDLFIIQSLKGNLIEEKAKIKLNDVLSNYAISDAEGYIDEELRVDLIVYKQGVEIGGIQVKPNTFKKMRRNIISFNISSNQKWGKPVFYLYYDGNENFINLDEIILAIKNI
jgi:hypothetical protein